MLKRHKKARDNVTKLEQETYVAEHMRRHGGPVGTGSMGDSLLQRAVVFLAVCSAWVCRVVGELHRRWLRCTRSFRQPKVRPEANPHSHLHPVALGQQQCPRQVVRGPPIINPNGGGGSSSGSGSGDSSTSSGGPDEVSTTVGPQHYAHAHHRMALSSTVGKALAVTKFHKLVLGSDTLPTEDFVRARQLQRQRAKMRASKALIDAMNGAPCVCGSTRTMRWWFGVYCVAREVVFRAVPILLLLLFSGSANRGITSNGGGAGGESVQGSVSVVRSHVEASLQDVSSPADWWRWADGMFNEGGLMDGGGGGSSTIVGSVKVAKQVYLPCECSDAAWIKSGMMTPAEGRKNESGMSEMSGTTDAGSRPVFTAVDRRKSLACYGASCKQASGGAGPGGGGIPIGTVERLIGLPTPMPLPSPLPSPLPTPSTNFAPSSPSAASSSLVNATARRVAFQNLTRHTLASMRAGGWLDGRTISVTIEFSVIARDIGASPLANSVRVVSTLWAKTGTLVPAVHVFGVHLPGTKRPGYGLKPSHLSPSTHFQAVVVYCLLDRLVTLVRMVLHHHQQSESRKHTGTGSLSHGGCGGGGGGRSPSSSYQLNSMAAALYGSIAMNVAVCWLLVLLLHYDVKLLGMYQNLDFGVGNSYSQLFVDLHGFGEDQ